MKKIYTTCLACLAATTGMAQTVYRVGYYGIPTSAQITVSADRGFVFEKNKIEYQLPLNSKITLDNGEPCLPLAVKNNKWAGGYSSLQSQASILSPSTDKFYWNDDNISFEDYKLSGDVIDSVKNVRLKSHTDYFGDSVDIVYLRVRTGETGMYSLPSNTYCAWKETTHVGKIAAMVFAYAKDSSTGRVLNNAFGVAKWYSSLSTYTGVSGKVYTASGAVEYFDDLTTAKDITLNPDNWYRNDDVYSLTSPTWQFLDNGGSRHSKTVYDNAELSQANISFLDIRNISKPRQSWLDDGTAYRFDTPDSLGAITGYSYTASDPDAELQYPEFKSAPEIAANQYNKTENNTWLGATCLYLVPMSTTSYSKYRKFDGYLHVSMADGSKYKRHFTIDKAGVISADDEWTQESAPQRQITDNCQDNGELQYFGLRFMPRANLSSLPFTKRMATFKEAKTIETDLDTDYRMSFLPCVDVYVPNSVTGLMPSRQIHTCNFSFHPTNSLFMESRIMERGVVLHLSDDLDSSFDTNGYNTWMFGSTTGSIIAYTTTSICSFAAAEWFE